MSTHFIMHDADVERLTDYQSAIAAIESMLVDAGEGKFRSPPRHFSPFDRVTDLVFSIGGSADSIAGARAYFSRMGKHHDDQVVMVWDMKTGGLKGLVLGSALGVVRMGAIGGVAIRALSQPSATSIAIIGSGRQAASHLEAAVCARPITDARVFGRSQESVNAFCSDMAEKLHIPVRPSSTPQAALDGADIVICATTSLRPVIRAEWLAPNALVHTVGYKSPVAKELDLDIADAAATIVTDSPAQIEALGPKFILYGTRHADRIESLVGATPRSGITLCYPMGVTGSEVVIANLMLTRAVSLDHR